MDYQERTNPEGTAVSAMGNYSLFSPYHDLNCSSIANDSLCASANGFWDPSSDSFASTWEALRSVRQYYTPCLVTVGIVGNLTCGAALLTTKFRKIGCVHYLAAIAITDAFFLMSVLLLWLTAFHVDFYSMGGWCHFIYLLSHGSNFLSVWLVAALSVDRYHTMSFSGCPSYCCPRGCRKTHRRGSQTCSTMCAKSVIIGLAMIATVVYINISLTVGSFSVNGASICVPLPEFIHTSQVLNRLDLFFNFLLPYAIVIFFGGATLRDMNFAKHVRKRVITRWCNPRQFIRPKSEVRLTKVFLLLCLVFIALTLPSQSLRLWFTVNEVLHNSPGLSPREYLWEQIFQTAFYTRFAMDFLVMIVGHKGVRRALQVIFLRVYYKVKRVSARGRYSVPSSAIEFTFQFSSTLIKLNETSLL